MLSADLLDESRILLVIDMCRERDLLDRTAPRDVTAFERLDVIRLPNNGLQPIRSPVEVVDSVITHPSHGTFNRVTRNDDTVFGIRRPLLHQLPT